MRENRVDSKLAYYYHHTDGSIRRTMRTCPVPYRRLKKKAFWILFLLLAFVSLALYLRVQGVTTEVQSLPVRDILKLPLKEPKDRSDDPTDTSVRTVLTEEREPQTEPAGRAVLDNREEMARKETSKEDVTEFAASATFPSSTTPSAHAPPSASLAPIKGYLNQHVWDDVCGFRVESVREFLLFPNLPSRRRFLTSFQTKVTARNFGERIFGFIHPDVSGLHQFAVSSNDNSELWLSSDDTPSNVRKIANVGSWNKSAVTAPGKYTQLPSQISASVNLTRGNKYFIELLHKQKHGVSHAEVSWKRPGKLGFTIITSEYISALFNDSHMVNNSASTRDYTETSHEYTYVIDRDVTGREKFGTVLANCPYEPSYLVAHKLARFEVGGDILQSTTRRNGYVIRQRFTGEDWNEHAGQGGTDKNNNGIIVKLTFESGTFALGAAQKAL